MMAWSDESTLEVAIVGCESDASEFSICTMDWAELKAFLLKQSPAGCHHVPARPIRLFNGTDPIWRPKTVNECS
jgi:hypothetical protein